MKKNVKIVHSKNIVQSGVSDLFFKVITHNLVLSGLIILLFKTEPIFRVMLFPIVFIGYLFFFSEFNYSSRVVYNYMCECYIDKERNWLKRILFYLIFIYVRLIMLFTPLVILLAVLFDKLNLL